MNARAAVVLVVSAVQDKGMTMSNKMETFDESGWIQTFTCKKFYPLRPKIEDICIEDIAHALSNICRFTGHSSFFYSVAQHCVLVSHTCNKENALYGLLHDASEAYISDISRPLKKSIEFQAYRNAEQKLQEVICAKFGLPAQEPADVKLSDNRLLATEARDLMSPTHPEWINYFVPLIDKIDPLLPDKAKTLFLKRFQELYQPTDI
jgi:5'-deoxynucleotidase YfbR-like HD superfamily hydrolase